ncbi:H/ACA RNA-protein complex protein Gar1 [Thermococci archaeon]|uniref:Gar1/Naf1 family protein n=1 Tax=Palaeococcus sp. (in: euryarchaeotes) TaxID=2820298 RepID=UPI000F0D65C1|nr:Gar1/Naf1 family protein [Palaeococcus sp. (in: euryarchaeotes)]MCD6558438.1 H/ACA RNA-protein complex protein Gar1 [Palaeococcus sp. (in: euryarchaeotes)]RLF75591.1 MAG: H/ACA RNA-protein complex protein Gar1 [Thermococci archaeon]RLF90596.1 MAG: H/ACA RNA-protein complex protein Gar1 [Thermococci archaeon]
MKRLGKVSHYAKQGFLIVRSDWVPSLNDVIVDRDLKVVGIVKDVFGPVKMPYVAVKPRIKKPEGYLGTILYVDTRKRPKKEGRKRGKGVRRSRPKKRG